MDRNEKQNSYKNMVSSRGNNREIAKLKRRVCVLSVFLVLLLAAVIAMGIVVGRMYRRVMETQPGEGGGVVVYDSGKGTETKEPNKEPETEPKPQTESVSPETEETGTEEQSEAAEPETEEKDTETESGTETEAETKPDIEIKTESPDENITVFNDPDTEKIKTVLDKSFGEQGYSFCVERKKPGETKDPEGAEEAGAWKPVIEPVVTGAESVVSDDLADVFVAGTVYQCLNESLNDINKKRKFEIPNDNNDELRAQICGLLGRSENGEENNVPEKAVRDDLIGRIGAFLSDEASGIESSEANDHRNAGIDGVKNMLRTAAGDGCRTQLNGFDEAGENEVYFEDLLNFMEQLETDRIWKNDNKAEEEKTVTTRDNFKSILKAPYAGDSSSGSPLREALKKRFEGYAVYWIEDENQLNHIAVLLEKKADETVEDCILIGLFAPENEQPEDGWSKELAEAVWNAVSKENAASEGMETESETVQAADAGQSV